MMKIVTGAQMSEIDYKTITEVGISGAVLMERAGLEVAGQAASFLQENDGEQVVILAGKGNNGGDGFVIARLLSQWGYQIETFLVGDKNEISGDAKTNLAILTELNIDIKEIKSKKDIEELGNKFKRADLIIDALLGTGIKGSPRGLFAPLIELVNKVRASVLAVDIPSGVEADTGRAKGPTIKAEQTVTFALPKVGLLLYPGAHYTGQIDVVDIGIPSRVVDDYKAELITKNIATGLLPARKANSHKGDYGQVLLVAGSTGMSGAAVLAAQATLRMGVGLLTVAGPESINPILETKLTEAMSYPLSEKDGSLSSLALSEIKELAINRDVLAVGPGLSLNDNIKILIKGILEEIDQPLVLDADALNAVKDLNLLKKRSATTILTPHPGEFSRLSGLSLKEIKADPIGVAIDFAVEYGVILILKDSRTIIANPKGKVYLNNTGNSGLATGGSGDVLTGIVTSLLAQSKDPFKAATLGVYLHGLAADIGRFDLTEYSFLPSDILDYLPQAIKKLRSGNYEKNS